MNIVDVVRFGHLTLLGSLESPSIDMLEQPGACGSWSIKDIVAHLGSYELVLIDILDEAAGNGSGPNLDRFREMGAGFNDAEVVKRRDQGFDDVLDELNGAHETVLTRLSPMTPMTPMTPEHLRLPGTIPWYGAEYSLDDLIVYMYYGHKREHAAQIAAFHDRLSTDR